MFFFVFYENQFIGRCLERAICEVWEDACLVTSEIGRDELRLFTFLYLSALPRGFLLGFAHLFGTFVMVRASEGRCSRGASDRSGFCRSILDYRCHFFRFRFVGVVFGAWYFGTFGMFFLSWEVEGLRHAFVDSANIFQTVNAARGMNFVFMNFRCPNRSKNVINFGRISR